MATPIAYPVALSVKAAMGTLPYRVGHDTIHGVSHELFHRKILLWHVPWVFVVLHHGTVRGVSHGVFQR